MDLSTVAIYALSIVPFALVWVVGLILALARWRRHPNVSLMMTLGCCLLLVSSVGGSVLQMWLIQNRAGISGSFGAQMSIIGLVRTTISVTGYILVLCAVFGWRKQLTPYSLDEPPGWRDLEDQDRDQGDRPRSEDIRKRP